MALDKFTQITKSGIVTTINFECHHLHSTGIATFSAGSISALDGTFSGDVSIGGTLTYQDVTNIDSVGLVTARLGLNVTAGVSTFAAAIDANGGVDISGGSGLVASTAKISDLTDNRVVIGGSSGELEDSANLTFDGSNLGVGSKVTVTNANADADNPNSLGAEINAAWIRLGDVTAAKSFSNGLGIKYYDQGTSHWSTGTIGNKFYISNTSNDGNKLFPSGRTDVVTCDTTGKVGVGTVTPGNTVHIGGTQGVGVRWHNYTSGNSAYHTLESGDKFQSNVGGSGEHGWVSAGGTKMTLTNAGRLGIGTAIPVGKFESYNTGLSTPTKTWGGGNPGQRLVNEGSELKIGLTAYSPYAYFLQANTSSGTDRQLTLNPMGGSVGIGLTNAQTDAGLVARYSNTHAPSLTWNTAGGHTLRNEGSELVFGLSNSSPHPYFLQARTSGNAAKQLVLNPLGGNVGIHETSPEEILDLGESNKQNLKLGQRGYLGQAYSTTATILGHSVKADTTNTVASQMMVTETNSGGGAPAAIRLVSGTIQFHTAGSGTANAVFDSERLRIDSSGNICGAGGVIQIKHPTGSGNVTVNMLGTSGDARLDLESTGNGNYGGIDFVRERASGTGVVGGSIFMKSDTSSNLAHLYIQAQSASAQSPVTSALVGNNGVRLLLEGGSGKFGISTGDTERFILNAAGGCHIGLPAITSTWDTHAMSLTTNSATFACPGTVSLFGGTGFGTANMAGAGLRFVGYYTASAFTTFAHVAGVKENTTSGDYGGALTFHTRVNGGLGAERLRITSGGELLINKTSSDHATHLLQLYANGTNSCNGRITTGGMGNNSDLAWSAGASNRDTAFGVFKNGTNNPGGYMRMDTEDDSTTYAWFDNSRVFRVSAAYQHIGTTSGTVVGTQTSDIRLKNLIGDGSVSYGLSEIKQITPIKFKYKKDPRTASDTSNGDVIKTRIGFSAQQVKPIIPEAVYDTDEQVEGEDNIMAMEYVNLIPVLINAVKELSAKVDSLETEVASLKES